MAAAIQVALGPKIRLSQWGVQASLDAERTRGNAGVAEGVAWMHGRLDLPHGGGPDPDARPHDTGYVPETDKVYNVFPPMMGILTVLLSPLHRLLAIPEGMWHPWFYSPLVFWPLPVIGFLVFSRQVRDPAWGALLTFAWIGGTAVLPNLYFAQRGHLGQINHVISQVGLLLLAADVLGRQRIWPGLIGVLISTYTRQMTFLFGLPLLWVAWRRGRKTFAGCVVGLAVIAAPLLTLNGLKFGNPLDFGYRTIYAGREDTYMGRRCLETGTFSSRFIGENVYCLHLSPPRIDLDLPYLRITERDNRGTSLWITTPLLLLVIVGARQWWRDARRRILVFGSLLVMAGLLCYHSPGYLEHGYSRFALDFLPVWWVVIAPQTRGGWRTWYTLGCTAWSLLYFQAIVPHVPIQW